MDNNTFVLISIYNKRVSENVLLLPWSLSYTDLFVDWTRHSHARVVPLNQQNQIVYLVYFVNAIPHRSINMVTESKASTAVQNILRQSKKTLTMKQALVILGLMSLVLLDMYQNKKGSKGSTKVQAEVKGVEESKEPETEPTTQLSPLELPLPRSPPLSPLLLTPSSPIAPPSPKALSAAALACIQYVNPSIKPFWGPLTRPPVTVNDIPADILYLVHSTSAENPLYWDEKVLKEDTTGEISKHPAPGVYCTVVTKQNLPHLRQYPYTADGCAKNRHYIILPVNVLLRSDYYINYKDTNIGAGIKLSAASFFPDQLYKFVEFTQKEMAVRAKMPAMFYENQFFTYNEICFFNPVVLHNNCWKYKSVRSPDISDEFLFHAQLPTERYEIPPTQTCSFLEETSTSFALLPVINEVIIKGNGFFKQNINDCLLKKYNRVVEELHRLNPFVKDAPTDQDYSTFVSESEKHGVRLKNILIRSIKDEYQRVNFNVVSVLNEIRLHGEDKMNDLKPEINDDLFLFMLIKVETVQDSYIFNAADNVPMLLVTRHSLSRMKTFPYEKTLLKVPLNLLKIREDYYINVQNLQNLPGDEKPIHPFVTFFPYELDTLTRYLGDQMNFFQKPDIPLVYFLKQLVLTGNCFRHVTDVSSLSDEPFWLRGSDVNTCFEPNADNVVTARFGVQCVLEPQSEALQTQSMSGDEWQPIVDAFSQPESKKDFKALAVELMNKSHLIKMNFTPLPYVQRKKRVPTWDSIDISWFQKREKYVRKLKNSYNPKNSFVSNVRVQQDSKVIAIGDIHADFNALLLALFTCDVIDSEGRWSGGNTTVVQVGDQIDGKVDGGQVRFTDMNELKVIQYVEHLQRQAHDQGGNVISLLGNHELRSSSRKYFDTYYSCCVNPHDESFGDKNTRQKLLAAGGLIATRVFSKRPVVVNIGKLVFSHADIGAFSPENNGVFRTYSTPSTLSFQFTFDGLNNASFNYLQKKALTKTTMEQNNALLFHDSGPLYSRHLCTTPLMNVVKGRYIFIAGHTTVDTISTNENQNVWCTDTKMSEALMRFEEPSKSSERYDAWRVQVQNHHINHVQVLEITNPLSEEPTFTVLKAKDKIEQGRGVYFFK